MLRSAEIGFGTATELADIIVRETGMSFRMAHNVVGRVVREAIENGKTAMAITTVDLDEASIALFGHALAIGEEIVRKALDPAENLKSRTATGGPAPERMREMIGRRKATFGEDKTRIAGIRKRIADADSELDAAARKVAGETGTPTPLQTTGEKNGTR
jgi:argininosuccinate lyase